MALNNTVPVSTTDPDTALTPAVVEVHAYRVVGALLLRNKKELGKGGKRKAKRSEK